MPVTMASGFPCPHRWFWEVVQAMGKEDRALLIQFVTGTSKVPLEGFKSLQGIGGPQKFQIHKVGVLAHGVDKHTRTHI